MSDSSYRNKVPDVSSCCMLWTGRNMEVDALKLNTVKWLSLISIYPPAKQKSRRLRMFTIVVIMYKR